MLPNMFLWSLEPLHGMKTFLFCGALSWWQLAFWRNEWEWQSTPDKLKALEMLGQYKLADWMLAISLSERQRHSFPPFLYSFSLLLFCVVVVFMPFISMAPQCTVGIAAVLAPCVRQRERSVSTPSIPHSDEREIITICGCVSHHLA